MTSILKINFTAFAIIALLAPQVLWAQTSLALSVAPTLFEISAVPGQVWQSSVKVVNTNSFPIDVYTSAVNFAPQGERGQGKFIPIFEDMTEGSTLAEWIVMPETSVTIPAETSRKVSFVVNVPENAAPGGHFAAILVGTQPPQMGDGSTQVRTSQVVTSLFFLRIEGDVIENAAIRSFTVKDSFTALPAATFELRFENKGNVHLQPQGNIEILNMWGNERGSIPINRGTHFGNVLPNSIRNFTFSWQGEPSIADIGRYKAIASLAYGDDERKFTNQTAYFWVVPVKALLITLSGLLAIILLVRWSIKAYVRRMLAMAGVQQTALRSHRPTVLESDQDLSIRSYHRATAPVKSGWHDFMDIFSAAPKSQKILQRMYQFVSAYRLFWLGIAGFMIAIILVSLFVKGITADRNYEVTISSSGAPVNLNSEQILFNELVSNQSINSDQLYNFEIINTSGKPGTAASLGQQLASKQYRIDSVSVEDNRQDKRTVIVFDVPLEEEALELSQLLDGALLSARATSTDRDLGISVYVGLDQIIP